MIRRARAWAAERRPFAAADMAGVLALIAAVCASAGLLQYPIGG